MLCQGLLRIEGKENAQRNIKRIKKTRTTLRESTIANQHIHIPINIFPYQCYRGSYFSKFPLVYAQNQNPSNRKCISFVQGSIKIDQWEWKFYNNFNLWFIILESHRKHDRKINSVGLLAGKSWKETFKRVIRWKFKSKFLQQIQQECPKSSDYT